MKLNARKSLTMMPSRGSTFCKQKLPIDDTQRAAPQLNTKSHDRRTRDKRCSGANDAGFCDICTCKAPPLGIPGPSRIHKPLFPLLSSQSHARNHHNEVKLLAHFASLWRLTLSSRLNNQIVVWGNRSQSYEAESHQKSSFEI